MKYHFHFNRQFIVLMIIVLVTQCTCLVFCQSSMGTINVRIGTFMNKRGSVSVALYDSTVKRMDSELLHRAIRKLKLPVTNNKILARFDSIPKGRYAILVMHDEDGNDNYEYLEEDFGVSKNVPVYYRLPAFHNASFFFDGTELNLFIKLVNESNSGFGGAYSKGVAIAPVISIAPETSLVLGANVVKLFKFSQEDTLTRPSFINGLGALTLYHQVLLEQTHTIFSTNEQYLFIGFNGFRQFPQYYFGIGNATLADQKEMIHYNQFRTEQIILKRVTEGLFAGMGYRYAKVFNLTSDTTFQKTFGDPLQGSVVSGIEAVLQMDNRDNLFNSSKGQLLRFKVTFNTRGLGSQFNFKSYELDMRKFFKLSTHRSVLALQGYGYSAFGNVPWSEMGLLGSDMIMRGYYTGRYRDKNYLAAQAEYRMSFNKLFGAVIFAGVGEVADSPKNFTIQNLKTNKGFGLRMTIDRKERLNLRFDYGFGERTSNIYFSIREAF